MRDNEETPTIETKNMKIRRFPPYCITIGKE